MFSYFSLENLNLYHSPFDFSFLPLFRGSPNIEMDEHTFLVNRERAVDYLNSLDKVFVNDQFLNWDLENRIKVRIVAARAYHSLFMHNM
ncbi:phosphoenolpyruvate carboxykinase ATP [Cinnamomum micranthum f. kanehirae]|uniref:Phosphoenolpyruvate carboxykinase ATP n=1 Tax=Cinnamomum micranthum f. kanehirae TaxID=337451 RepID=A0A3S3MZH6_9MAGN|nr:phosphoenolpyruvate carboxykinase ATP [Cinnamomum micranthum f. kanehirae]